MAFQFTPYVLLLWSGSIISLVAAIFAWRRRPASGAATLAALLACSSWWSLCHGLMLTSTSQNMIVFWLKMQWFVIPVVPLLFFIFGLEYTGRIKWLKNRLLSLLVIEALIVFLLTQTNEIHRLYWKDFFFTTHDTLK